MRPERTSGEGLKGSGHSASAAIVRAALARRVRVLRLTKGWSQGTLAEIGGFASHVCERNRTATLQFVPWESGETGRRVWRQGSGFAGF